MAWLEHHNPWIDSRSKTLSATRTSLGGILVSHEPTSARTQKRYWREHWTELVDVLDIGVSELSSTGSWADPWIDTKTTKHCSRYEAIGACQEWHGGRGPRHLGQGPSNSREVTRYPLDEDCGNSNSSSDVVNIIKVSIGQGVEKLDDAKCVFALVSMRRLYREKTEMPHAIRKTQSINPDQDVSTVDDSTQLYTLVNGMTGKEDGDVTLKAISAVDAPLKLDEMSFEEFGGALKAGG
ncbi:uncharacterized protein PHALS_10909 [Plasmopara halstedii]|uniref:Uncharacterized protein n=1 Tax=Plasmopara halstedii TaxID=4781 RepID=A0A0P1AIS1_PLAHL|nr:uncharacterized protein PHALS_10909 [Plasmopara halstedii]CEG40725.1 hypothetical protein PHALS_10909 [Plasmopara halstedii]|eukprot:XP_024577094.1 hypothetical protein PHALS_10909 [Plasmopara halstedii]